MTQKDGNPCKRCGKFDYYSNGNCRICALENAKKLYRDNRADRIEYARKRRREHPEKISKASPASKEKKRLRQRERKLENPDIYKEYYKKNREKALERNRLWAKKNPEKDRVRVARRRARKNNVSGEFTDYEWNELCNYYNHRCLSCGKKFSKRKLEADHIVPLYLGGENSIGNIQPLCKPCNASKGIKTIDFRPSEEIPEMWVQPRLL